jgi:hypothetical protein
MPDGSESLSDDDLSLALNQLYLGAAGAARDGDRLAMEMLTVIEALSRRMAGVPASLEAAPAGAVIMARVRARRLNAAIGDALTMVLVIDHHVCGRDPELALPGASAISAALGRARAHLADLGPEFDLGLDLDRDITLARQLTSVLTRSASFNARQAWDLRGALLASLREARFTASDLVLSLAGLPVDASGADLSSLDIRRLGGLHGVTWTRATSWPPAIAAQVLAHSTEELPGRYRIRVPYARGSTQAAP